MNSEWKTYLMKTSMIDLHTSTLTLSFWNMSRKGRNFSCNHQNTIHQHKQTIFMIILVYFILLMIFSFKIPVKFELNCPNRMFKFVQYMNWNFCKNLLNYNSKKCRTQQKNKISPTLVLRHNKKISLIWITMPI